MTHAIRAEPARMIATAVEIREVTLRRATLADSEQVWEWSFASDVRALSTVARQITLDAHTRWYKRRIADTGAPVWIACEGPTPIGVVRIDRRDSDCATISIALSPRARGRGLGRRALTAACLIWSQPLVAEIPATNCPSRICFEACGFEPWSERDGIVTYHWSM
jgi:RimJ/RimL family protein N-acetyltransferase